MTDVLLPAAAALGALCILAAMARSGRPVRMLLYSGATGLAALALVNLAGLFTGVTLAVSPAALGCSCLGGVPGVIGLLMMRMLL